ncbi:MAG: fatty acid desaturase [Alphaproteobacteria bacterium]
MEGWIHRRDLIDPQALKALSRRSNGLGALQLASQLVAIAALAWGIERLWGSWWGVPVFLMQGALLWGFGYAGQHELIHRTVFRARWANDGAAYLAGFLRFFPSDYSRAWHFVHHRHTKDPERDSELIGTTPLTVGRYVQFVLGLDYLWWRWSILLRVASGRRTEPYFSDVEFRPLVTEARIHLALYALIAVLSIAFGTWIAVTCWIAPLVAATPFYRFYIVAEHYGRPQVPDIILNSRTTRAGWFLRWLMWNMPYHTEHHLFPGVPFHKLGALARALRAGGNPAMTANAVAPNHLAVNRDLLRGLMRGDPLAQLR